MELFGLRNLASFKKQEKFRSLGYKLISNMTISRSDVQTKKLNAGAYRVR